MNNNLGKKVSEFGYSKSVMVYGTDVDILDTYIVEKGYLKKDVFELSKKEKWFRSLLVKARKNALHDILTNLASLGDVQN